MIRFLFHAMTIPFRDDLCFSLLQLYYKLLDF